MSATTSQSRKYLIAVAAILAAAATAFGIGQIYPPRGPSSGVIAAAQGYVESVAGEEIPTRGRYVLVDAASARLFMIEDGRVRDTMRVIVGKPTAATPALKSALRHATLNPYWNVPPDLAQTLIAPRVLKDGTTYLTDRGYEIVSGFDPGARVLSPEDVDWGAVAAGKAEVLVRQRPGAANSMGQMKFDVVNGNGIYLHDTPKKELFAQAERKLSNGCVRLEDARRFARWLLGNDPPLVSTAPEQRVALPGAVPITIAYLDARAQMQVAGLQ
jgi:murein L,D-transpeptidase YcbB/YkuD